MAENRAHNHIISTIGGAEFDARVLAASRERPVLVDFWADWCQPCHMLAPVLEDLARELDGRAAFVKVNADSEPDLASRYAVRSLPTVMLFVGGSPVSQFAGVRPPEAIRAMLAPHLPRKSDGLRARAANAMREGRCAEAIDALQTALQSDPDNHRVHPELAEALMADGRYDEADNIIKSLPVNLLQDERVALLQARLGFARTAQAARPAGELDAAVSSDPGDLEARYELSAHKVQAGEFADAMEQLMEIIRRDRSFRDDAGRRSLLDLFTILGNRGELVRRYRTLLSSALH